MKRCSKCKQEKPAAEFNKNRAHADGLHNWCKACCSAYWKTPEGKAVHKRANARYRQTDKGKIEHRKGQARYKANHPERVRAKDKVRGAVKRGKMPKASTLTCAGGCGDQAESYHHPDYTKELEVLALCRTCHLAADLEARAAASLQTPVGGLALEMTNAPTT